ncbi:MAG: chorismate mutase [Candidatus Levyibacteriota bacterium]
MKKDLQELRKVIDTLDAQIIELLAKRMQAVKLVGEYKAAQNIQPLDKNRWQEVLDSKREQAKALGLSEKLVEDIYERIHQEALRIEKEL